MLSSAFPAPSAVSGGHCHTRRAATALWLEEDGCSSHSLSPPAKHPSLPPSLPPLPSLGLCRWLNAGILSQRLPVARRAGAPEKLGKCMWVTASQAGAFHSPLPSFFSSFLCLCSSLAPSVSAPERADIVVCRPRYFQMIFLDGALRLPAVSSRLITSSPSLCLFLTRAQTEPSARGRPSTLKRIWSRCFTVRALTSFQQLPTSSFCSFFFPPSAWLCARRQETNPGC